MTGLIISGILFILVIVLLGVLCQESFGDGSGLIVWLITVLLTIWFLFEWGDIIQSQEYKNVIQGTTKHYHRIVHELDSMGNIIQSDTLYFKLK